MPRPAPVTTATRPSKRCSFTRHLRTGSHQCTDQSDVPSAARCRGPEPSDEPRRSEKWTARRDAIVDTSAHGLRPAAATTPPASSSCATVNGLGKGAFYHYIGSKEELLAAIHDRVMDEVHARRRPGRRGGRLAVRRSSRCWATSCSTSSTATPITCGSSSTSSRRSPAERAEQFRVRRREYERRVEAVLQAGIDAGEFRDVDPGSPPSPGSACTTTPTSG